MNSESLLQTPLGAFELLPLHHHPRSPLRAWNAADELLLEQVHAANLPEDARILLVNDSYGALAVTLHAWQPHSWSDSICHRFALEKNLARNTLPLDAVHFIPAHQPPEQIYDVVLLQLPKTLSLLEHQLTQLRQHVHANTLIIAGGMVKHMATSMTALFSTIIGATRTSLAQKKARLIFATFDASLSPATPASPRYLIPNSPLALVNHANVFSQQKLDIGTRFLLDHFPALTDAQSILDLGCGNGALGIFAGWQHPAATLHFVDESYLAVQSAQDSAALNTLANPAHYYVDDVLDHFTGTVDAIVCNPPFHEGNKVHTDIAARMFRGASRHLAASGTLYIVANRHLDYRALLAKQFARVKLQTSNPKFIVIAASEPHPC